MLVVGDFAAILVAFALAYILRVTLGSEPFQTVYARDYAVVFLLISPFWISLFGFLGLYNPDTYEWRWRELARLLVGSIIGIMGVITYDFVSTSPILPARIVAVYGFAIAFALLIAERTVLRMLRRGLRRYGWGIVNAMLVGDGPHTSELLDTLSNTVSSGYRVVGLISERAPGRGFSGKHFTSLEKGLAAIEKLGVHSVILTELYADPNKNALVMATAQANHCGFRFIPAQEGLMSSTMSVELFQGMPVVAVHQTALTGGGRIVKRLFDIVASALGLIILSPFMLIIYLSLVATGGKAIYKRKRLTRYDRAFNIYKFRSLKVAYTGMDPEEGFAKMGRPELIKQFRENGDFLKDDPRISRLGKFLRRTSLDELPQLFNILRGDISLVGPRALIAEELDNYPYKNLILSVKSGLTGLAQISGRRELPFEERRKLDLYYVQNWSFWFDIKILTRTLLEILKRSGD